VRSIFVNLPVRDVAAARAFFAAVGFRFCEEFGDPTCACLVVAANAFVLLMEAERFRRYVDREPGDPARTEVVTAVSAASRAEVDATVARAVAAGGTGWRSSYREIGVYAGGFRDLDGHAWEVVHVSAS
jgi:predicted lactoylglutathione lyase